MTDPMMTASVLSRIRTEREEPRSRELRTTVTVTPMRIADRQPEAASEVHPEAEDSSRVPSVMHLLAKKRANEHDD